MKILKRLAIFVSAVFVMCMAMMGALFLSPYISAWTNNVHAGDAGFVAISLVVFCMIMMVLDGRKGG